MQDTCHHELSKYDPMLATSLPVAQWLERPTGVRKVMASIRVGDSDVFCGPRSRRVEYSIFSYFFSELKNPPSFFIYHLSSFFSVDNCDFQQLNILFHLVMRKLRSRTIAYTLGTL